MRRIEDTQMRLKRNKRGFKGTQEGRHTELNCDSIT